MSYKTKTLPSGIVVENKPNNRKYCWYIKGTYTLHNEGGPAVEFRDGAKYWCQHGTPHRLDGPAYEYGFSKAYYIDGLSYSEKKYWNHSDVIAHKYLKEHPELAHFI